MSDVIKISDIVIRARKRAIDDKKVRELANSIMEIGLINPVTIGANNELLAGMHRLQAYILLGIEDIPYTRISTDDLRAELVEIDENLARSGLHYIEVGEHLARRKEIYETLHPETRRGMIGIKTMNESNTGIDNQSPAVTVPAFVDDAAEMLDTSASTIMREIRIAEALTPDVKDVVMQRDMPIRDAEKLVAIFNKDQEQAEKVVQLLKDDSKPTLSQALTQIKLDSLPGLESIKSDVDASFVAPALYTIGYSGKELVPFIEMLIANKVGVLVDIRDSAVSHYKPDFSDKSLARALTARGIQYVHLKALGVPHNVRTPYIEGYIDTTAFAGWYQWNIEQANLETFEQLVDMVKSAHTGIVLMCSEQYAVPTGKQTHACHRKLLADAVIRASKGVVTTVTHL